MKLLSILLSLLFVAGCSFKKDGSDTAKTSNSNDKEILANTLSSNFDKLALAISTNDSKLFYSTLKVSSRADLNKLSSGGRSLLEMALDENYFDYFRDLLEAGISPFRPTYGASRLRNVHIEKRELRELVVSSERRILAEATLVCLKNDLSLLEKFIEENYIPLNLPVCGNSTLFEEYLDKNNVDHAMKVHFVFKYVSATYRNYLFLAEKIVYIGFTNADRELLSLAGSQCMSVDIECMLDMQLISEWIKSEPLGQVLNSYSALRDAFGPLKLRTRTLIRSGDPRLPLPPPPRQGAVRETDIAQAPNIAEDAEIVSFVKMLIKARLAETPDFERETVAQQLHDLELN
nr:hypothetical protein [uncultured Bdellovibrio sp.]